MTNQQYDQPLVSIDVVPLRYNRELKSLQYGVSPRLFEPFKDELALPGVLLRSGEAVNDAAERALQTKAGLPVGELRQFGVFVGTNRDPRGATISIAFLSVQYEVDDGVVWVSGEQRLPFDHSQIAAAAQIHAKLLMWKDMELTQTTLGKRFTVADVLVFGSPTPHASNVGRWLDAHPSLRRSDNLSKTGSVGRPAVAWEWLS